MSDLPTANTLYDEASRKWVATLVVGGVSTVLGQCNTEQEAQIIGGQGVCMWRRDVRPWACACVRGSSGV